MIYEIEKDGTKLEIWRDKHPQSPREDCNLGTIFAAHRRYKLGEVEEISHVLIDLDLSCSRYERLLETNNLEEITDAIEAEGGVTLPIYIYDHGGITIATTPFGCRWDSGRLGFIYVLGSTLRKEFGWKRISAARVRRIKDSLQSEIDEFNQYLQGMFGYLPCMRMTK